ncbi:Uncharacterized conserved protein [Phaffia rhodozyma]|uniref:Uncharacterized conserved protein n=1 Tax=Phaffia rhodozyma TaxID=264483 RepID=A0A0F7SSR0_PHARH|nr:Uncharacterized conserved protein [Phaffia rhodozyma]
MKDLDSDKATIPSHKITLDQIKQFDFERILNDDPALKTLCLLGKIPDKDGSLKQPAIFNLEKRAFNAKLNDPHTTELLANLSNLTITGANDIYHWSTGWLGESRPADIKVSIISPCTDVHIKKHSKQKTHLVRETPELYNKVTLPFIQSFPASRTQWVRNILNGVSEQEDVVYTSPAPLGFTLLPDAKWDRKTLATLYLTMISKEPIPSLRSLRAQHLPLLREMRVSAEREIRAKWPDVERGTLRFFIHYQPSYYHFHVHVTHVSYNGALGMSVERAHLLDNVISLLEIDGDIFDKMTLTYALGEMHGLWKPMKEHGGWEDPSLQDE